MGAGGGKFLKDDELIKFFDRNIFKTKAKIKKHRSSLQSENNFQLPSPIFHPSTNFNIFVF